MVTLFGIVCFWDQLSVDYIIPLAVAQQLDCVAANLELLPKKGATPCGRPSSRK